MSGHLSITGLAAGYRGKSVVEQFTLAPIAPGEVVALLGPNAAGKTTVLRSLAGLHKASGSVKLGKQELMHLPLADHAAYVTYMPQALPDRVGLTVLEAVMSALRASIPAGMGPDDLLVAALDVIERVGITHLAARELGQLSGGQRQLASLAQALVRRPTVLLLDEPISALDLHFQLKVMKLVREVAAQSGMIVIMVLHDLTIAARWSDRIVLLSGGKVEVEGSPAEALTAERLAQVYKVCAAVSEGEHGLQIAIHDVL
ncbi:ABC transporter ATP-binding protein [Aurantiacibacter flavus]|uniref:ABC transporter ATP-binding protein n=1 Tax=Aurantiacibacter flavus TaxID=3145232 RepID=A0ABV0CYC0_9SPHN